MSQRGFTIIVYLIVILAISGGILGVLRYISKNKMTDEINFLSTPYPAQSNLSTNQPTDKPTNSTLPKSTGPILSPTPDPVQKVTPFAEPTSGSILSPTPDPVQEITPFPISTSTPVPKVTCIINVLAPSSGWSPLGVYFSYSVSDQSRVTGSEWDLDGDGMWESEGRYANWTYKDVKSYEVRLRFKLSGGGYSDECSKIITVNPLPSL